MTTESIQHDQRLKAFIRRTKLSIRVMPIPGKRAPGGGDVFQVKITRDAPLPGMMKTVNFKVENTRDDSLKGFRPSKEDVLSVMVSVESVLEKARRVFSDSEIDEVKTICCFS